MGGKSRLAREIAQCIATHAPIANTIWDPFCGGGATAVEFAKRWRVLASDALPGLAGLHQAIDAGLTLPAHGCSEEEYKDARGKTDARSLALTVGLAFGGMPGASLAHPPEKYARQFNKNCAKQRAVAGKVTWAEGDYAGITPAPGDIVYCDPPYLGTTGYPGGPFDHSRFFTWCASLASRGAIVFVSEFTGRPNWRKIWSKKRIVRPTGRGAAREDCLFEVSPH
jgi:DNA adenine methylase